MNIKALERVAEEFKEQKVITPNYFGTLTLTIQKGKIELVRIERTIKPK